MPKQSASYNHSEYMALILLGLHQLFYWSQQQHNEAKRLECQLTSASIRSRLGLKPSLGAIAKALDENLLLLQNHAANTSLRESLTTKPIFIRVLGDALLKPFSLSLFSFTHPHA